MSDLKDGLIHLNTLYPLTYVNMATLATSLETVQSNLQTLAEIKTEGCVCACISTFTTEPAYTLPTPPPPPPEPVPSGVITFGTPSKTTTTIEQPFSYSAGDATGFKYYVGSGSQAEAVSPIELTSLNPNTFYTIYVAAYNDGGIGTWASTAVKTLPTPPLPLAPQYFVVFQTPTVGTTTISQPFTYEGADYDSFIATVNGESIGTVTSPIELTGLEEDTDYVITVTPVNTEGSGYTSQTTVHTNISEETLIILNLEIEAYYAYGSDRELLPTGYLYPTAYSEYLTNQARFNVFLGGILIGELNLNNGGGATDVSPNFTALVPVWSGSPFSRYDTLTITLPQAKQIAAAITAAGVSLKFVPISTPSPHSSITARFTIKDATGTVVSNIIHLDAAVSGSVTYTLQIIE